MTKNSLYDYDLVSASEVSDSFEIPEKNPKILLDEGFKMIFSILLLEGEKPDDLSLAQEATQVLWNMRGHIKEDDSPPEKYSPEYHLGRFAIIDDGDVEMIDNSFAVWVRLNSNDRT